MNTRKLVLLMLSIGLLAALVTLLHVFNTWSSRTESRVIREDVLQEALGFSQKEMVLLYSGLLEMTAHKYKDMETCTTRKGCAQRAFTRLLSRFHNSKILPEASRWWANGSFEREWIERFLTENALPLIPKNSRCLEWGTFYMEKVFGEVCSPKDSLENSDIPQPATNATLGLVYHDDIYVASTIPDNSYDVIICAQVYEHLHDPVLATKTMFRILKPGGLLVATGPHACPFHAAPDDYFRYTHHGIASILKRGGLTPIFERQFGNIMMLVNIFEGVPVKEVSEEDLYSKVDEAYAQWTIIARKPLPGM